MDSRSGFLLGSAMWLIAGCGTNGWAEGEAPDDAGASNADVRPSDAMSEFANVVPPGFTETELGGYALGPPITGDAIVDAGAPRTDCSVLVGIVRDFKDMYETDGHPDFHAFRGDGPTVGLLGPELGADRKPVYASRCEAGVDAGGACPYGQQTTSQARFDQWYRSSDGVNKAFTVFLAFVEIGAMRSTQSQHFFPIDGVGWGDLDEGDDGKTHNFGFTTELRARFLYEGGESFTFTGDDDAWVFVNGHLAIDLGGLHPAASSSLDLDRAAATLGLDRGREFPLEVFHAERHNPRSTFRIDTDLVFTDCGAGRVDGGARDAGGSGSTAGPCASDGQACEAGRDCCSGSCANAVCVAIPLQ